MTWFKVDDGFWGHPKQTALPPGPVALWLSTETVKSHRQHLYRALDARCAAHAVALVASGRVRVDVREDAWSS